MTDDSDSGPRSGDAPLTRVRECAAGLKLYDKGYALVTGPYNINLSDGGNSATLSTYAELPEREVKAFVVAELMQNAMDWVYEQLGLEGSGVAHFTFQAADRLVVSDQRRRRGVVEICTRELRDKPLLVAAHVRGVGLVVIQSGCDAVHALTLLPVHTTTKRARGDGVVRTSGGYGVGFKQLLQVSLSRGWPLTVWGTVRGHPGVLNRMTARRGFDDENGAALIEVAGSELDAGDANFSALLAACGVRREALWKPEQLLVHVLPIPDSYALDDVMLSHSALAHGADDSIVREPMACVFGGNYGSRMYVNGIFSGYYHEKRDMPDVMVVGDGYTDSTRGYARVISVMDAVFRAINAHFDAESLAAACAVETVGKGDAALARMLRDTAPYTVLPSLKRKVSDTDLFRQAFERMPKAYDFKTIKAQLRLLRDSGWLPDGFQVPVDRVRVEEEAPFMLWMLTSSYAADDDAWMRDEDYNAPSRWLSPENLYKSVMVSNLGRLTVETPALQTFNRLMDDAGVRLRVYVWSRPWPLVGREAPGWADDDFNTFKFRAEDGTLTHVHASAAHGGKTLTLDALKNALRDSVVASLDSTLLYAHFAMHAARAPGAPAPWDDATRDAMLAASALSLV